MVKKIILKTEAEKLGYIKNKDGKYCRDCVLDKYYRRGYLDLPNSRFSAEDRKRVGERLALDYYLGLCNNIHTPQLYDVNIPTTGDYGKEKSLYYRECYLNAVKSIPYEFWNSVRRVCIENKELVGDDDPKKKSLRNKNCVYYQKMMLNLGLDRLVKYYLQKNKK